MTHFNSQVGLEQELFIVSQLNNKRHIKDILQPSNKKESQSVTFSASMSIMILYWQKTKGIIWPKCMEADEGPRPVYKKKGFFCS